MSKLDTLWELVEKREQLCEDIDCIVDCFDREKESNQTLVTRLCDAVRKNFPIAPD